MNRKLLGLLIAGSALAIAIPAFSHLNTNSLRLEFDTNDIFPSSDSSGSDSSELQSPAVDLSTASDSGTSSEIFIDESTTSSTSDSTSVDSTSTKTESPTPNLETDSDVQGINSPNDPTASPASEETPPIVNVSSTDSSEGTDQATNDPTTARREKFVAFVRQEAQNNTVAAKTSAGVDESDPRKHEFRQGWEKLLQYFEGAYNEQGSGRYFDQEVKYLPKTGEQDRLQSWCGIFALWALKQNGLVSGDVTWKMGGSFYKLSQGTGTGIRKIDRQNAKVGDIGILPGSLVHHFIVTKIDPQTGRITETVNGNGENAGVSFGSGEKANDPQTTFYTVF